MISRLLDQDLRFLLGKSIWLRILSACWYQQSKQFDLQSYKYSLPSISLESIGVLRVSLLGLKVIKEIILPSNQGFIDTGPEVLKSLVAVFL